MFVRRERERERERELEGRNNLSIKKFENVKNLTLGKPLLADYRPFPKFST